MGSSGSTPDDPGAAWARQPKGKGPARRVARPPATPMDEWARQNPAVIGDWHHGRIQQLDRELGGNFHSGLSLDGGTTNPRRVGYFNGPNYARRRPARPKGPHPFFGGPGQPTSRFSETDAEWYARNMDPRGVRTEPEYNMGRKLPPLGAESMGRMGGSSQYGRPGPGSMGGGPWSPPHGQQYQPGGQGDAYLGAAAGGGFEGNQGGGQAGPFPDPYQGGGGARGRRTTWQDEAEAFLNQRP